MIHSRSRGFTLIELLVAISIGMYISGLAVVCLTSLQKTISRCEIMANEGNGVSGLLMWGSNGFTSADLRVVQPKSTAAAISTSIHNYSSGFSGLVVAAFTYSSGFVMAPCLKVKSSSSGTDLLLEGNLSLPPGRNVFLYTNDSDQQFFSTTTFQSNSGTVSLIRPITGAPTGLWRFGPASHVYMPMPPYTVQIAQ